MNQLVKFIAFSTILFLVSCGPDYILDHDYEIKDAKWAYADQLNYEIEIPDALKIYNLYIEIEHATDFPKQNMYVMIHTQFPSGKRISEQVSLEMANKLGVWYGNCNADWCTLSIPIQQGAYFDIPGTYTFTIEQYMRLEPLPGVKRIGFKIEDTGQQRGEE